MVRGLYTVWKLYKGKGVHSVNISLHQPEYLCMFAFLLPNLLCFQTLKKRCDEELRRRDLRTMQELDKKVMDQQGLLEKAGVPGFFVTNGRQEIQQQMYLLDFICRVAQSQGQGR